MKKYIFILILCLSSLLSNTFLNSITEPPLFSWKPPGWDNFGDALSKPLVERIVKRKIRTASMVEPKLLAVGSIIHAAYNDDVVWGSGILAGQLPDHIHRLDVRAVRGPLTRDLLLKRGIPCPAIYGDPALLIPLLFPEFTCNPIRDYIIIPHWTELSLFEGNPRVVSPKEPWQTVVKKITESKFVIASSLHGIIVAEAFGIPARMLLKTNTSQLFKYKDYYQGTGRPNFKYATTIAEALKMGGEPPAKVDLGALLGSFPFELWEKK